MNNLRVAIAGGAGYTGAELLRLLVHHPYVELVSVMSSTYAGLPISQVHRDLAGETSLVFDSDMTTGEVDVLFLCLGHGASRSFLQTHDVTRVHHIIDLSQDFRHRADAQYTGTPERTFLYALPEATPDPEAYARALCQCGNVANPGCFATAIQLALLPLAAAQLLQDSVHIHGITGSTGAGAKPAETSHFSYRDNNLSIYKLFNHQHLVEIRETLDALNQTPTDLLFVPVRGDFPRGIFVSLYTHCDLPLDQIINLYDTFYAQQPFVWTVPYGLSLKEVVNTNKCLLHIEKQGPWVHVTSIIDNLLKGASGTAVQNMNILAGFSPDCALKLKSPAY